MPTKIEVHEYFRADDERLHLPGEQLEKEIQARYADLEALEEERNAHQTDAEAWLVMGCLGAFSIAVIGIQSVFNVGPGPIIFCGIVCIILSVIKVRKAIAANKVRRLRSKEILEKVRHLHAGREGEVRLGMFLERVRNMDGYVLHDLPAEHGNIDHLMIAPWGIYAIEGKVRERKEGKLEVSFDGEAITVHDYRDTKPVDQANKHADLVKKILEVHQIRLPVTPLLVYWGADKIDFSKVKNSKLKTMNRQLIVRMMDSLQREYLEARDMGETHRRNYLSRDEMWEISEICRDWALKGVDVALKRQRV